MERSERVHEKYDPEADLAKRWPGWTVLDTPDVEPGERFFPGYRTVVMNSNGDREWLFAHVVAHLDLDHHVVSGDFTPGDEADADWLAGVRLDLLRLSGSPGEPEPVAIAAESDEDEWDDVPMDGEPTVYR
jgi:hypothetical protein